MFFHNRMARASKTPKGVVKGPMAKSAGVKKAKKAATTTGQRKFQP